MLLLPFLVKGTVSIATILWIPSNLEQEYPLFSSLVAGVTLVSFLQDCWYFHTFPKRKNHLWSSHAHRYLKWCRYGVRRSDLENTKTRYHSMRLLTIIMDVLKISSSVRRTRNPGRLGSSQTTDSRIESDGLAPMKKAKSAKEDIVSTNVIWKAWRKY